MKGLLIKDYELLKGNFKVVGAAFLMAVLFMFTVDNGLIFVMYYMTMMSGFLVLSTLSYDDFDNGMGYLMTLPVTRKTYVLEKYFFGMGCVGVGWVVSAVLSLTMKIIKYPELGWDEWLLNLFCTILVFGVIIAVMIPIQLKFGSENMRIILIGIMLLIMGAGYLLYKIGMAVGVDFRAAEAYIESLSGYVIIAAVLLVAGVSLTVSCKISENILDKKEF